MKTEALNIFSHLFPPETVLSEAPLPPCESVGSWTAETPEVPVSTECQQTAGG